MMQEETHIRRDRCLIKKKKVKTLESNCGVDVHGAYLETKIRPV